LLRERQELAAEVHDSLGQSLAFVKMRMPLLHDAIGSHDDARTQQYYDDIRAAVSQAHANLRGIITHLRAPMDPQGLLHALGASVENFRRSSGAELDFVNELPDLNLAPEQETQVFHIVQEALTNVARHAGAQTARLHIAPAEPAGIEVVVEDDGAGLPERDVGSSHYGLQIMAERARRIGGTLEVGTRPGGGTRLRLAFPLSRTGCAGAA
jgi:two-component system, NarL family, nitrate/nitrite sensor histidine kinase NarX